MVARGNGVTARWRRLGWSRHGARCRSWATGRGVARSARRSGWS